MLPRAPGSRSTSLEDELAGALLRPGEPAYEQARRVWNGALD
jgi:hypothetical protein